MPGPQLNKIYQGDAVSILKTWPDNSLDAIVTDPPWLGCNVLKDQNAGIMAFIKVCQEFPRLTDRVVVILGCDTDPRFLRHMPIALPFVRTCWLRRVPPVYKGSILYSADVAYVFGAGHLPEKGYRVLPGEHTAASRGRREEHGGDHPCPRNLDHMRWLVRWFTRKGSLKPVCDPFAGSGTIPAACAAEQRNFVGIEIDPEHVTLAERRVADEMAQGKLF